MHTTFSSKARLSLAISALAIALAGCSAHRIQPGESMDAIYERGNTVGQQDAVRLLRRGLAHRANSGSIDPVYPMRKPEVVAPVWRPDQTNPKTGRREGGQWQYIVIEESAWAD